MTGIARNATSSERGACLCNIMTVGRGISPNSELPPGLRRGPGPPPRVAPGAWAALPGLRWGVWACPPGCAGASGPAPHVAYLLRRVITAIMDTLQSPNMRIISMAYGLGASWWRHEIYILCLTPFDSRCAGASRRLGPPPAQRPFLPAVRIRLAPHHRARSTSLPPRDDHSGHSAPTRGAPASTCMVHVRGQPARRS